MDKYIVQIAKETDALRADSRRMLDEWIRLGEPEQLHKYSDQYLGLKIVVPAQFVRVADLPGRLPPPRVAVEAQTDAGDPPAAGDTGGTDEAEADDLPLPPLPPSVVAPVSVAMPAVTVPPAPGRTASPPAGQQEASPLKLRAAVETRSPDEPRPATPKPVALKPADPRSSGGIPTSGLPPLQAQGLAPSQTPTSQQIAPDAGDLRTADGRTNNPGRDARSARPAPPDPRGPSGQHHAGQGQPQMQAQGAAPPSAGSLLGMSRGAVPLPLPLPAPTPISATWVRTDGTSPNGPGR